MICRLRGFAGTHVRQLRRTGYAQRDVVVGKDRLFGKFDGEFQWLEEINLFG